MITSKDERWMRVARKVAECSSHDRYLFSSVLVRGGNVLSVGVNKHGKPKGRPHRENLNLHAEAHALCQLNIAAIRGATLYVYGRTIKGNDVLSKPCSSCEKFIIKCNLFKVVYVTVEGTIEEIRY